MLRYVLPTALLVGILAICYRPIARRMSASDHDASMQLETVPLPHGRCLYLVLERDGVYIGQICVAPKYLGLTEAPRIIPQ